MARTPIANRQSVSNRVAIVTRSGETIFCDCNGNVTNQITGANGTKATNATYVTGYFSGTQGLRGSASDTFVASFALPQNFHSGFSVFMFYNTGNMTTTLAGSGSYSFFGHTVGGSFNNGFMRCHIDGANYKITYDWLDKDGNRSNANMGSALSDNTNYSFGVTFDGKTATIYHNGSSAGTFNFKNAKDYNPLLYLGGDAFGGSDTFRGTSMLSNFIVFNRALSSAEILSYHNGTTPPVLGALTTAGGRVIA